MRRLLLGFVGTVIGLAAIGTAVTIIADAGAAQSERPGGTFFDDNETTHEANIEAIARAGITGG